MSSLSKIIQGKFLPQTAYEVAYRYEHDKKFIYPAMILLKCNTITLGCMIYRHGGTFADSNPYPLTTKGMKGMAYNVFLHMTRSFSLLCVNALLMSSVNIYFSCMNKQQILTY